MTTETGLGKERRRLVASTALAAILLAGGPLVLSDLNLPEFAAPAYAQSCCFTAETPVLLFDGSVCPIAQIQIGDVVLSGGGTPNRVTAIERVPLGDRRLYAINDTAPFFTQEHPFLTAGGWRSVSPMASFAEVPALRVRALTKGDLLVGVTCGPVAAGATALAPMVQSQLVRLVRLASEAAPAELDVYNLILDGDRTYVANSFVVHNKGGEGGEGGDGGDSGGEGGDSGGEGGDSGGEGGDSGGEGGDSGGEGGDSGGEGGDSGGEGGDSGGEGGDSGGEGGDSGGEGGESGSESGEGGSGEGGESGGEGGESGSGGEGGFEGSAEPAGPDLTPDEERDLISRGWE